MARVLPVLADLVPLDDLSDFLVTNLTWYDSDKVSSFSTLIRKSDFKMYKYDTRCKNIEKVFSHCKEDYLDPLDREMLVMRHRQMNVTSTPAPKWLNMCWDSFRHVDNHNKSHMF